MAAYPPDVIFTGVGRVHFSSGIKDGFFVQFVDLVDVRDGHGKLRERLTLRGWMRRIGVTACNSVRKAVPDYPSRFSFFTRFVLFMGLLWLTADLQAEPGARI